MFNIIQFDIEGRRVLDLFGGTGQLGIECLSRGAAHATFVDARTDAVKLIREKSGADGSGRPGCGAHGGLRHSALQCCGKNTIWSFLDPPYETKLLERSLN